MINSKRAPELCLARGNDAAEHRLGDIRHSWPSNDTVQCVSSQAGYVVPSVESSIEYARVFSGASLSKQKPQ